MNSVSTLHTCKSHKMHFIIFYVFIFISVPFFSLSIEVQSSATQIVVGDSVQFFIYVPDASSADTDIIAPSLPDSVRFLSQNKRPQRNPDAVVFTLTFSFKDAGVYNFPPFLISVGKQTYSIELAAVSVIDTSPKLYWHIPSQELASHDISLGHTIFIELHSINSPHYDAVDYELSETALFDLLDSDNHAFPIRFMWTPLFTGIQQLPSVTVRIRDQNNREQFLRSPPQSFTTVASTNKGGSTTNNTVHASIEQSQTYTETSSRNIQSLSIYEDAINVYPLLSEIQDLWLNGFYAQALAQLRSLERATIRDRIYAQLRKEAEQALSVNENPFVLPLPLLIISIFVAALALIVAFLFRKRPYVCIVVVCAILCTITAIVGTIYYMQPYAVYTGGILYTVPDKASSYHATLNEGAVVRQHKKAGSWVYVSYGDNRSGWIEQSTLIPISHSTGKE